MALALVRLVILTTPSMLSVGVLSVMTAVYNGADPFWPVVVPLVVAIGLIVTTIVLYRRRKYTAIVLYFLTPIALWPVSFLVAMRLDLHWRLDELLARAESEGHVQLTGLVEGWSLVCLATPYCSKYCPDCDVFDDPVCGDFQSDVARGGIVFLSGKKRVAIQRVALRPSAASVWLDERQSEARCITPSERPALFAGPNRSLFIRATQDPR